MRKLIVFMLVVFITLGGAGDAGALNVIPLIDQLRASGLGSNSEINQTYVDLSNVSNGTVTSATYIGVGQTRTDNSYTVVSQTYWEAMDRITSYVFALTNQYRPDTEMGLSGIDYLPTVHVYTYGTMKDQAMYSVVSGLVDCLGNPPVRSSNGSSSWVNNYSPAVVAAKTITSFKIGEPIITTASGSIIKMDVVPYVKNNRTYTPVRYLAYSLGVTENQIQWNAETQTVTITKDKATIKLTIGSTTLTKNSEVIIMDVAPEIIEPGRTMLPARWVSEALGATVTWDEKTQKVTITLPQGQ